MKLFLLSTVLVYSGAALAQMNNWTFQREVKETARSHREYKNLQAKYPGMLRNEDPRRFKYAVLHILYFQFTGEHTCADGDARLTFRGHGVTVCHKNNACYSTAPLHPFGDEDPCLE